MGVDAMMESLDLVKAGVILKHDQRLADGSYESWFKKDLAHVDWSKPVADVHNVIRAADPAPGAWGTIAGTKVDLFEPQLVGGVIGEPGAVVSVDDSGVVVAAAGGGVRVRRVRVAGGKKVAASEWAKSAGIAVGARFDAVAKTAS